MDRMRKAALKTFPKLVKQIFGDEIVCSMIKGSWILGIECGPSYYYRVSYTIPSFYNGISECGVISGSYYGLVRDYKIPKDFALQLLSEFCKRTVGSDNGTVLSCKLPFKKVQKDKGDEEKIKK